MANLIELKVPDIGGSKDVPVIELLAAPGDAVRKDQGLATLESDKATMEIPSSAAGILREWKVKVGDVVSEGTVIALLESAVDETAPLPPPPASPTPAAQTQAASSSAAECPRERLGDAADEAGRTTCTRPSK